MPLSRRVPKLKGFKNPFRIEYTVVNLDALEAFDGTEVTPDTLRGKGLVHKRGMVKVLGRGELTPRPARDGPRIFRVGRRGDHRRRGYGRNPAAPLRRPSARQGQRPHQPIVTFP